MARTRGAQQNAAWSDVVITARLGKIATLRACACALLHVQATAWLPTK
ncbi:hypothetical protein SDC9_140045 [bioreactor metagenome]|uniref:Uncharacterized protein n=1 Tax=bioreactor metagenome TaxID=1076179 RepID=A0A645DUE6_9ZZZZ